MSKRFTDCLYRVSFRRYRPLTLPLSCDVGPKRWILGPRSVGAIPQILDMRFQIAVTSEYVPILVEFRSASSEIRRSVGIMGAQEGPAPNAIFSLP